MQGTFVVVEADGESAVLRAVDTGQVVALSADPGLAAGAVIDATVERDDTGVAYTASVEDRRAIPVEAVDDPPGERALAAAEDTERGDLAVLEGEAGTVHVLPVPPDRTGEAVRDVVGDAATVERAARLGADRVEVRSAEGLLSVRYLGARGGDAGGRGRYTQDDPGT